MGMTIGELARRTDTTPATIRFYESKGLLGRIGRRANGRRDFGAGDVERVNFLRGCRELEIPLPVAARLVRLVNGEESPCEELGGLLDIELNRLQQRVDTLRQLAGRLRDARSKCDAASCGPTGPDCEAGRELSVARARTEG
jgi:DNA-binding transcriptional MerR regulator